MRDYQVKPLASDTWGRVHAARGAAQWCVRCCWCTWFHTFPADKTYIADANRALKQRLVDEGGPHAALVFDGDEAVARCEYGTPVLYKGTRILFEQAGFTYVCPKGMKNCVMRKAVH